MQQQARNFILVSWKKQ